MEKSVSLPSPAKINRFFHIIGRRHDGMHLLQTLFQFLNYGDQLSFTLRTDHHITLHPAMAYGIAQEQNLIYRAAKALQQASGTDLGASIGWEKQIPQSAGLGGGSSNAATCLFALNWLWDLQWTTEQLIDLGVTLGADIPFFLYGHAAWGEGIGEKLTAIELPQVWVLVIVPPCHVETRQMYAHPDLTRNTPELTIGTLIKGETELVLNEFGNDFESVVRKEYPEVDYAIKWLSNYGCARLSGSGASVFACFPSKERAKEIIKLLPPSFTGFIAEGTNKSPLLLAAESLGICNNWGVAKR